MSLIEVNDIHKEYKVYEKKKGFKGLVKNLFYPDYKMVHAVKGVNFRIEEGDIVGYIGTNGAGKSTTIKMLSGILTPTSGSITVDGVIPYKSRVKSNRNIGAVFGQRTQMWWDLPPIDTYMLAKKMYDITDRQFNRNLERFKEILEIDDLINTPVRQLSLGQKMRCEIAMAFLHSPKVVYLDEPTIGLDIFVKEKIRKFIKDINKEQKTTIILTTHDMQDIEEIADRVMIIDEGKKIFDGSINSIKKQYGKNRIAKFQVKELKEDIAAKITGRKNQELSIDINGDNEININFNLEKYTTKKIISLISDYCEIVDFIVNEPTIESIVKDIYKVGIELG